MGTVANMVAVLLLITLPYVRPCDCGEFTLFCACSFGHQMVVPDDSKNTPEPMCPN